jgi:hypothetical protein
VIARVLRVVRVAAPARVFVGPEVDVDDFAHALDVNHLSHCLAARVDGDHVIARIHQISDSAATEKSAAAATLARSASAATGRCLRGTKI